ncbi:MAG TPA: MFS transporter [Polyangia bacterium]|nr:MFS transporter [Polyangia bacterium]
MSAHIRRDLRMFYLYRLLSAAYLFVPAQIAFLLQRGLTWTEIFVLNSVFNAVLVAFEVPTGALADRFGRRFAMMLGSLSMALAFLIYYVSSSFALFALAEGTFALGMTLTSGPDSAYLYDLLKSEGQARRYTAHEGTASSFKHIGMTVAFAVGGFLGQRQVALPYLCAAGVCVLAAVCAACLREAHPVRRLQVQRWGGYVPHMSGALKTALRGQRLRYAILYSSLIFVLLRVSLWMYQPYLSDAGLDLGAIGLVFAGLYGTAALCSHNVQKIRAQFRGASIYWVLPAVLGATYLLLGRFVAVWGVALLVLQKAVDGIYSPLTKELLNREIEDSSQRATVLSVESMVRRIAFGLFAPACGVLFDHWGRPAAFYLCALTGGLGALALLLRRRAAAHLEGTSLTAEPAAGRVTRL